MDDDTVVRLELSAALPDHMARLAREGSTGILAVATSRTRREILLVKGEIRAARSSAEEEKLGMWLVDRGTISEDDRALSLLSQGGEEAPPLGHLLVARGSLEAGVLERELQEMTLAIIRRAAGEPALFYEFVADECPEQPDTLPDLFTAQIILIAARACDDHRAKLAALGSLERTVWRAREFDLLLQEFNLTPTEGFLLSRLEGTRSISDLFQVSALPDEQAIATLYPLIVAGVVSVGDATRRATAARPAAAGEQQAPAILAVKEESLAEAQRQERANIRRLAEEGRRVDHYGALGLRPGADRDELNRALLRIQERFATSRTSERHLRDLGPQLEAICERASEAHQVLSDWRSRERYDAILKEVQKERERLSQADQRVATDAGARSAVVEANVKRADELVREGEFYLAIQLLEHACKLDPRPAELVKLAQLLLRNPLWTNRALAAMRRAIEVDPEYVEAWLELALFWHRRRNQERERKALEKALAADPGNLRANQMYKELAGKRELERLLRRAQQQRD
jgi:tetratricopeptide (TPR) repeat protein